MKIFENYPLKKLNTFRTGGNARFFCIVKNAEDFKDAVSFSKKNKIKYFVLGGGSNILINDSGFSGLVIKNEIFGKEILQNGIVGFSSGEKWDDGISFCIGNNLFGLENLSYIPGTVGGAVVQNIGAYGSEIKDFVLKVEVYDVETEKIFEIENKDCNFSYRNSIFKIKKNLIVTKVYLSLDKKFKPNFSYGGIKEKIEEMKTTTVPEQKASERLQSGQRHFKSLCSKAVPPKQTVLEHLCPDLRCSKTVCEGGTITKVTAEDVRNAVISTRKSKLPEVSELGSAGSFFKNPIIDKNEYARLKKNFPDIPSFLDAKGGIKISLAWILDKVCGLKNYKINNVGLYKNQPLVLVNFGGATTEEIINLSDKVKNIVKEKTGIKVEEEVIHIF